jgi:UDP-N-acetylglucosamine transferase subunit ALG13
MSPAECRDAMLEAAGIIAHAGMGTVLCALELGKPLLIVPRRASLGEHRNEHQMATARRLAELGSVSVAFAENGGLAAELDRFAESLHEGGRSLIRAPIGPYASAGLITAVRSFIEG